MFRKKKTRDISPLTRGQAQELEAINKIKNKMELALEEAGFAKTMVNNNIFYEKSGYYHCITFVKGLSAFVIESAMNLDEAEKNLFEDSDAYPLSNGEDQIIMEFKEDLLKYYLH